MDVVLQAVALSTWLDGWLIRGGEWLESLETEPECSKTILCESSKHETACFSNTNGRLVLADRRVVRGWQGWMDASVMACVVMVQRIMGLRTVTMIKRGVWNA